MDAVVADVAYARMRWNTPLSIEHADLLLDRMALLDAGEVLDLGCGWAALLIRALAVYEDLRGVGVDTDAAALARGRADAMEAEVADRLELVEATAAGWTRAADRVACVGSSHALGGLSGTLRAAGRVLPAGGRLLLGEGYWARDPSPAAVEMFGDEPQALGSLVEVCRAGGWRVLHLSTADQREWDDFESTWRAGRQEWLLANPGHASAPQVREQLDGQLRDYLEVYRETLGFAYLVLRR